MKRKIMCVLICGAFVAFCPSVSARMQHKMELLQPQQQEVSFHLLLHDEEEVELGHPVWEPIFRAEPVPADIAALIADGSHTDESPVSLVELAYVTVAYVDFEGMPKTGHLIVHKELGQEVADIFEELYAAGFPIAGIALVEDYGCDDSKSMEANNTYSYCTRNILGSKRLSQHSYGTAIDINPVQNPYVVGNGVLPAAAKDYLDRTDIRPGMIVPDNACYNAFASRGWFWGGWWANPDYQHFEKQIL